MAKQLFTVKYKLETGETKSCLVDLDPMVGLNAMNRAKAQGLHQFIGFGDKFRRAVTTAAANVDVATVLSIDTV